MSDLERLMRPVRTAAIVAAATGALLLTGGVAIAAPTNDTYPNRTVIGSVPFAETVDTATATTDSDDADLNATCGAPATDASVWYELTASTDGAIIVDVSAASYTAGVLVATGGPGAWVLQTCGPGAVIFPTTAGETYAILAIDDQSDGGGNGGTLRISVTEAPPPPSIDVTIDPIGHLDPQAGSVTVTGTVTCTGQAEFAFLETELRQQVGRFTIIGSGFTEVVCDGVTHQWSAEVVSENGKYSGGKAADATLAVACGTFQCGVDYEQRQVKVRR
jgi:hypothetical protein